MKTFVLMLFGQLISIWGASCNSLEIGGPPSKSVDCELARAKCAYRASCARALHGYMVDCADVLAGRTVRCPWACKRALISLTSSEAGYQLSTCDCGDNEFCSRSKERIEVCRPEVTWATAGDTVVSCSVAQWICHADPLCSTALGYYHRLCRSLFHGKKCTPRCNNSLAILDRQDKASKLRNCYCDGTEDFPCDSIRRNTQALCFGRDDWTVESSDFPTTTSDPSASSAAAIRDHALLVLSVLCLSFIFLDMNHRNYRRSLFLPSDSSAAEMSAGNSISNSIRECDQELTACSDDNSFHQRSTTKSGMKQWPWWWTSESL